MKHAGLKSIGVIVVAVALLAGFRQTTPSYSVLTGPIGISGRQGKTVAGRTFSAEIRNVRLADRLRMQRYGKSVERDTGGVWMVVSVKLAATTETSMVTTASWLGPSGRRYAASRRVDGAPELVIGKTLQPGLPRVGLLVFEVPPDEVRGGTLLLSALAEPRLDSELRIRLATDDLSRAATLELSRDDG